jgi:hypothetical protein
MHHFSLGRPNSGSTNFLTMILAFELISMTALLDRSFVLLLNMINLHQYSYRKDRLQRIIYWTWQLSRFFPAWSALPQVWDSTGDIVSFNLLKVLNFLCRWFRIDQFWTISSWVELQPTTRRHIPEDDTLHNHCCENLKSYSVLFRSKISSASLFTKCKNHESNSYLSCDGSVITVTRLQTGWPW